MTEAVGLDPVIVAAGQRWPIRIDGDEMRRLSTRYEARLGEADWARVVETSAEILSCCPDPHGGDAETTILALGKVQSGKTLSYTALTALAFDNGYRIVVVLAGTKNPLLSQTYERLRSDLDAQRLAVTLFRNPPPNDADVVRGVLDGGGNALICILKTRKRIDSVRQLLSTPELRGQPILIIDDEGDEASLNTAMRRNRRSVVYNAILTTRGALSVHAYVAYTATPQANLLISKIDELSPDSCVLIEPGSGYCGAAVFFGDDRDRYLRIVPPEEGDAEPAEGIPDGMRDAVATFLVGGVIRHLRGEQSWNSMLIHSSNLRAAHERTYQAVRTLIQGWRDALSLGLADPAAASVLTHARAAYDDLITTVETPPTGEDVRDRLREEVKLVELWMVNSLPVGKDPIATPFRLRNNILVGGEMLGRGVTIPDLAVTYITRRAQRTNADTVEQRARWFGYKQSYLDVSRIFMTPQLVADYTELLRSEDDFWDSLARNRAQGLSIRDWPRMLALDMDLGMQPTRSAVANFRRFRSGSWDTQDRLTDQADIAAGNVAVAASFLNHHPGETKSYGNVEHRLLTDMDPDVVIAELLAGMRLEGTGWDNSYVGEYLTRLRLGGLLAEMDVMFMVNGERRIRETHENGAVNLMQGRSPGREPADPLFYPGDENVHNDRVQLQVHKVQRRGGTFDTIALALYIPPEERLNLRYVVRSEE